MDSDDAEEAVREGVKAKQDSVELEQEKDQLKSFQKSFNVRVFGVMISAMIMLKIMLNSTYYTLCLEIPGQLAYTDTRVQKSHQS